MNKVIIIFLLLAGMGIMQVALATDSPVKIVRIDTTITHSHISTNINKVTQDFLGGLDAFKLIAYIIWGMIGIVVNLITDVIGRTDKTKFTINYWGNDNKWRLIASMILMPVAILLSGELLGLQINNTIAFFIGFGSDHITELLKKKNILFNSLTK